MPNANYTEIITTTLAGRNRELADNVSNGNALLMRLLARDKVKSASGRTIVEELEYAENSNFQYFTGMEILAIAQNQVMTAAEFDWKQAACNVVASGLETEVQNTGREAVIPLLKSRISNAMKTMRNNLATGTYSDGTGSSGKQIGGLQHIIADDPTSGTVGGIDRSDSLNTFWRNQTSGNVASIDTTYATLRSEMHAMYLETKRGMDTIDLIVSDQTLYTVWWGGLTDIQRITSSEEAVGGFKALKFVDADVVYDGDSGIPSNHMYFLNTDYLYMKRSKRAMRPMSQRQSVNQDAIVVPVIFDGNLTCSNAARQGVVWT